MAVNCNPNCNPNRQPLSSSTYGIPGLALPGTARPGTLLRDAALALPPVLYSDDGMGAASYSR